MTQLNLLVQTNYYRPKSYIVWETPVVIILNLIPYLGYAFIRNGCKISSIHNNRDVVLPLAMVLPMLQLLQIFLLTPIALTNNESHTHFNFIRILWDMCKGKIF